MVKLNENYKNVKETYLFSNISKKVSEFQSKNPGTEVIKLGIGDVTLPLPQAVVSALNIAVEEMGQKETFRGYGPYEGYDFLREAIVKYYEKRNVPIKMSEVFVSDGAKSDLGNILDLFSGDNTVLIPDPVYPVYVDTNIMAGRKIIYLDANEENGFLPLPDYSVKADIIYLCSPNNPIGAVYSKEQLSQWVKYAKENGAVILFDAAYEAFIQDEDLPRSIFEIDGAKDCAIEFCSFSKTAGFTGVRCGYTIVPKNLEAGGLNLNQMWFRRQSTKFNGVSYIVQAGAYAVFTQKGQREVKKNIAYYMENAKIIAEALSELGIWYTGGKNSPYIWLKCPNNMSSWEFFDYILEKAHVVGTPGEGFGRNGEGFFRLTAFGDRDKTIEAVKRIKNVLK